MKQKITADEIMNGIRSLAQSQGLYSRLWRNICELGDADRKRLEQELEDQNFTDFVDFVLWFEG